MIDQIVSKVGSWTRNKIVDPLIHILQRGAEPKLLALSAALGITLGVFPICGESITGGSHFLLTSDALRKVFTGEASKQVLLSILRAMLGWLVAVPFIMAGLYVVFLPCFTILVRKFSNRPPSPRLLQPLTEVSVKARDA